MPVVEHNPPYGFEIESVLSAPPEAVWSRISTPEGINDEFRPLARMTFPSWVRRITPESVPFGRCLCRSWILLFGILPTEYDDVTFLEVEPGRRFLESSAMLSQKRWVHERTLEAAGEGCRLRDRVSFEPRLPLTGVLYRPIFRFFFRHRHGRLRRRFGELREVRSP